MVVISCFQFALRRFKIRPSNLTCPSLKSETYCSKFKGVSSFERNFSFKSFKGPRTEWPKTNSKGLKPRDSCTDSLTANSNKWMPSSLSFSV